MDNPALSIISAIIIGLGATLTFDLWGLLLKRAFKVAPSNICLVGRWLRYMPGEIFVHSNIGSVSPKRAECTEGWIAHYLIGITFAYIFVTFAGSNWLENPTPVPAIIFFLFAQPILTVRQVEAELEINYPTAQRYVERLEEMGLLREITGHARNREYRADEIIMISQFAPRLRLALFHGYRAPASAHYRNQDG